MGTIFATHIALFQPLPTGNAKPYAATMLLKPPA
jgi:hypothetical protein